MLKYDTKRTLLMRTVSVRTPRAAPLRDTLQAINVLNYRTKRTLLMRTVSVQTPRAVPLRGDFTGHKCAQL